jgi:GNAT superfamily N-acetyltransferase
MQPSATTSTPPATIIPLAATDHAEWAPLWRGYLDFYRAAVDAPTTATTFARLTGGVEPMGGFLARGGGVGRLLIDAVAAKARALGCSRVHWLTHETNRDAMRLYDKVAERSGFVQYRIPIV